MFSALTTFLISLTSSCAALLYRHKMIEPGGLLDWLPNYFPENDKWRGMFIWVVVPRCYVHLLGNWLAVLCSNLCLDGRAVDRMLLDMHACIDNISLLENLGQK